MEYQVVIPAAGSGTRMGAGHNKLFIKISGQPMIARTLKVFQEDEWCTGIILAVRPDEEDRFKQIIADEEISKAVQLVKGGENRQDSVGAGLDAVQSDGIVLVHDGARPLITKKDIHRVVEAAEIHGAAILASPVKDTIKKVKSGQIVQTVNREELYGAQTPQAFKVPLLQKVHQESRTSGVLGTDEASLVELAGEDVFIVESKSQNIKMTTPEDLMFAEQYFQERETRMRIGQGFDVHRFAEGRPLIIGGIEIPYDKGLDGHSDADVLLHAISDALLGAIGEGDIGYHFPDTDPEFKGADSKQLLKVVWDKVTSRGYSLGNIDAVIIAQKPKMAPYIKDIRETIADLLGVSKEAINIKATTTEKLGFAGREEGIAAQAVCLIVKSGRAC